MCKDLLLYALRTKIICIMLKINVLDNKKIQPKIHKGFSIDVPCLAACQLFINCNCKKRSSLTLNMAVWGRLAVNKKFNNDNCQ